MKKLFVALTIVGVIQIVSAFYYHSKLLEQPLAVAGQVDFANNNIKLSYITNTREPHEFESIEIAGQHYYPEQPFAMFSNEPHIETYAEYTYYSVISPIIWLGDEPDMEPLRHVTEGTIHFKGGERATIALTTREHVETPQFDSMLSSVGSEGMTENLKVLTPFTLEAVKVVDDRVALKKVKINSQEITLPITAPILLEPGDTLYIVTTDGEAHYKMELFTVELHITEQGQPSSVPLSQYLNTPPSEDLVNQLVKGSGAQ